jgi:hypothetical protein
MEKRKLIDLGVLRSSIKVRQNRLIVNDVVFGVVRDSQFHYMPTDCS